MAWARGAGLPSYEHCGGVHAGHAAEARDRVDDDVEVVAPVLLGGDENLGLARPVREHVGVAGVFVDDVLSAVHHGQVGGADDFVGADVVGGQVGDVVAPEAGLAQGVCRAGAR